MKNNAQGENHSDFAHRAVGSELAVAAWGRDRGVMLEISIKVTARALW